MALSRRRKRERDEASSDVLGGPSTTSMEVSAGESVALLTSSFCPRPTWTLGTWQAISLSVGSQLDEMNIHQKSLRAHATVVSRQITKLLTEQRLAVTREIRVQWFNSRRIGRSIMTAMKKTWDYSGRLHAHILKVDFDAKKHEEDATRQEELLAETEALTHKMLEDMLRSRQADASVSRPVATGSQGASMDQLMEWLQHDEQDAEQQLSVTSSIPGSEPLEGRLRLLNTLGGSRPLRSYQRSALKWMIQLYDRGLNGILADEMGLGKTVQTLALLAYFAEYKNDWGPHLIVVPTTVVLNWAAECKRWVPGFKVMTYIGTMKERLKLRQGWTQEDAFHICITTYNLVVRDRTVFRRRAWGLMVLDEAHYIKNFASQKWRALYDLQCERRLMLTGTPLQSSVMELWALFHFLLPFASAFRSDEEFRDWFSNPMHEMVEGRSALNESIVRRLQALLRPFLLRRLKRDVESQLPTKTERVILCPLSRRQRALYDEFLQQAETKERLRSGGMGGVLGVILALRKVCNHPDLFAERPTRSPFVFTTPFGQHRGAVIEVPRSVLMTTESGCRPRTCTRWNKMVWARIEDVALPDDSSHDGSEEKELVEWLEELLWDDWVCLLPFFSFRAVRPPAAARRPRASQRRSRAVEADSEDMWERDEPPVPSTLVLFQPESTSPTLHDAVRTAQQWNIATMRRRWDTQRRHYQRHRRWAEVYHTLLHPSLCDPDNVIASIRPRLRHMMLERLLPTWVPSLSHRWQHEATQSLLRHVCVYVPRALVSEGGLFLHVRLPIERMLPSSSAASRFRPLNGIEDVLLPLLASRPPRVSGVTAAPVTRGCFGSEGWVAHIRRCFSFPERRMLIHDCGKLQILQTLLRVLRSEGHRALIFTQFTVMLDILEKFLACIGFPYLRIDGSTKPTARQQFVDIFNTTDAIPVMILSTRSGGIGLNLTGADTVIFYDSDWNPTIDLQAQDRVHRIGQTRPVTIYRLVSEHTVEEKILEKAREKKLLNNIVIRGGQFHAMTSLSESSLASGSEIESQSPLPSQDPHATFAALTSGISLKSFFHDLDEDATIEEGMSMSESAEGSSGTGAVGDSLFAALQQNQEALMSKGAQGGGSAAAMDYESLLAQLEDAEDQQALRTINEEIAEARDDLNQLGDSDPDGSDEEGDALQRVGSSGESNVVDRDSVILRRVMAPIIGSASDAATVLPVRNRRSLQEMAVLNSGLGAETKRVKWQLLMKDVHEWRRHATARKREGETDAVDDRAPIGAASAPAVDRSHVLPLAPWMVLSFGVAHPLAASRQYEHLVEMFGAQYEPPSPPPYISLGEEV